MSNISILSCYHGYLLLPSYSTPGDSSLKYQSFHHSKTNQPSLSKKAVSSSYPALTNLCSSILKCLFLGLSQSKSFRQVLFYP